MPRPSTPIILSILRTQDVDGFGARKRAFLYLPLFCGGAVAERFPVELIPDEAGGTTQGL